MKDVEFGYEVSRDYEVKTSDRITTLEMEVALMNYLGILQNTIVPNVAWSFFRHEVDILSVTKAGYGTEIEIKISKADLKKDKDKKHNHESVYLKYLYFAVPDYLADFALENIPERAGLIVVSKKVKVNRGGFYSKPMYWVKKIKQAKVNPYHKKWSESDINQLRRLGTMRILGLKRNLLKEKQKGSKYE